MKKRRYSVNSHVVEFQNACKIYPNGTEALKNINFKIGRGEIVGLIGPNGAGKTTAVKSLLGLLKLSSGSVKLWGHDSYSLPLEFKKKIGFLLDDRGLYENMTVEENMIFWAKVYSVDTRKVKEILERWDLWNKRKDLVKELSSGLKQKLAIAKVAIHDPLFIVMDEPTSNLDPVVRRQVVDLLKGFAGTDKTIIITSHDLYDIERVCTRILMIRKGKIIADGSMEELKKQLGVRECVKIIVSTNVSDILKKKLSKNYPVEKIRDKEILVPGDHFDTKELVKFLVENNVGVERVETEKVTLEDIYIKIVKEDEE